MALSFSVFNKFKAIDGVTAPIKRMTKSVGAFGRKTISAFKMSDRQASKFGKNLKNIGRDITTKITLPIAAAGGIAVKMALDFESAFTGVIKTVSATQEELSVLKKELIDMSRGIPVSTTEIFKLAEQAGQLGIKTKNIAAFTKVMADLKATTNLEDPATDLARFANIANVADSDFEKLGSTIVDLGNNLATTEADIVEMSLRLGAAGKVVRLNAAETLSLGGALSSVGLNAEAGGTAFSQVMIKINKELGSGSKKMKLFAAVSGKTVGQFEKQWKDDTANALLSFIEGLKRTQGEGFNVNKTLDELGFSGIRISDALLRAAGAGDNFRKAIDLGNKAWSENNALAKEAALRYGTNISKLIILKNKLVIMASTFGDIIVPILIKMVNFIEPIIEKFENLTPSMKKMIVVAGIAVAVIGPLLVAFGAIAAGITFIIGLGAPFAAVFLGISATITGITVAIVSLVKMWPTLIKGFDSFIEKAKKLTSLKGIKSIFGFVGREDEARGAGLRNSPVSPNAGIINTVRQESENKSKVDVNFNNLPSGTDVKQTGNAPGFNLNMGFSGGGV